MNILIVANHYAVCSARYAADAFARLGHTVRHVGQTTGRNIWGMQVPEAYVWTPQDNEISGWPSLDLTIVMDSDPSVLDDWHFKSNEFRRGAPIIVWGVDNHVRDYRREYFNHYFLAHKSVSVIPWGDTQYTNLLPMYPGVYNDFPGKPYEDMTWLPCAYDPIAFPPSPIPWEQRAYDVCMIGVMYPKRWELVQAMRAAGLKVLAGTGLVYDAYRDAYQNSRVALVSSFNGDLPIRLFEGAGMGCAVLCDPIQDLNSDFFRDDQHRAPFFTYRSAQQAVEGVELLTRYPAKAQEAMEWAAPHTWDARAQVIIDWTEARS